MHLEMIRITFMEMYRNIKKFPLQLIFNQINPVKRNFRRYTIKYALQQWLC